MEPITTGIPLLDRALAFAAALSMLASLVAHFIPADSKAGQLVSWIALNFGKALRRPQPPPSNVTELKPPQPPRAAGSASISLLAVVALLALFVGFALHSVPVLVGASILAVVVLLVAWRYGVAVLLLLALGNEGCLSSARKDKMEKDIIACGIACGVQELGILYEQAKAVLADGSISDQEAQAAVDALTTTAPKGLVTCVVTNLLADLFAPLPDAPPATTVTRSSRALVADSSRERIRRRASAWLQRG